MRLGYNTNGFAHHRLRDALQIMAELGYRSVGLTLDHQHLDPAAPDLPHQLRETRALLAALDLVCVVETGARFLLDPRRKHRPTLLSASADERACRRAFLLQAIDIAVALQAGVVSLWSGSADDGEPVEVLDARLSQELRLLCQRAADVGVTIGFEPEPGMYVSDLAGFARLLTRVDHPALQLTLDVGHAHLTEADGAAAAITRVARHTVNVHLEGMRRPVHDHLVPWEGDLDLGAAIAALRATGYAGPATLELSRHSHDAVRIAGQARAYFRELGL
jgi:sugar phosphate isomerase/epimerase